MTSAQLRQTGYLLVAGVFLLYASVLRPVLISPDERSMLAVALGLLDGDLSVPADMGSVGPDGRTYSNWYPLASVIAMPAVAVASQAAAVADLPPMYVAAPFAALTTVAVTAIGSLMVWLLALRLGGSPPLALQSALIYALGTVLLFYGRSFFADPLLATLVTCGLWSALGPGPRASRLTMACTALAVLAKPTGIVLGGAIAAWHLTQRQWQRAGMALSGALIGMAIYGLYNWLRFGDATTFGQRWGGFTLCCVPEAVSGLLVSPGRGLLLYSPLAGLGLWALVYAWRTPPARLMIAVVAGFIAIHAVWGDWLGGWSWGSRLLVPVVGALCASVVLAPPHLRRLVPILGLAGCLVNVPTVVWSFHQLAGSSAVSDTSERDQVWALGTSQLVQAWPAAVASVQRARQVDVRTVVAAAGINDSGTDRAEVYKVVPVWWWMTPAVGVPLWISSLFASGLMLSGAGLLWRAWRTCAVEVAGVARHTSGRLVKVAVVSYNLPRPGFKRGGIERVAHDLSQGLATRGHDVTVFSHDPAPPGAVYAVAPLPWRRFVDTWAGRRVTMGYLGHVLSALPPFGDAEVVIAHGDSLLLPLRGRPVVRVMHGSALDEARSATSLGRWVLQLGVYGLELLTALTPQRCVAVSENTTASNPLVKRVIPNGVNLSVFCPRGSERSTHPTIVFVGALTGRKRGAWLVREFHERIRPHVPDAELHIVSAPGEAGPGVVFHTGVDDSRLAGLYRQAWVYASPSTYEGFGLPYVEAMACGAPVVASSNPGSREVLAGGRYGVIADDTTFSEAVVTLLGDAAARGRLSAAGLARAADYSLERTLDEYERLVRSLVTAHG